jgi:preprotein translocase subunit Sec63
METTYSRGSRRRPSTNGWVSLWHLIGLEVAKEASKAEIKKAYFKLALIWHPDNIRKKHKYGFAHE